MVFEYFTPLTGTIGGSTIGLSAATLLLFNGDILGASGIMASVLASPQKGLTDSSSLWKLSLMGSFMITSALIVPQSLGVDTRLAEDPSIPIPSTLAMTAAGLLVGLGTRLGNGCTSGHGICGLGRESPRSLAGVLTFMATAMSTIYLTSPNFAPLANYTKALRTDTVTPYSAGLGYSATLLMLLALASFPLRSMLNGSSDDDKKKQLPRSQIQKVPGATLAGALFGAGLAISGMVLPSKLYAFLNVVGIADGSWDPTLCCVMGAGMAISWISYQFVPGFGHLFSGPEDKDKQLEHPINSSMWCVPTNRKLDWKLLTGEAIFGIGWGVGLLCPGPALYHMSVGNPLVTFLWMPAFLAGAQIANWIKTW